MHQTTSTSATLAQLYHTELERRKLSLDEAGLYGLYPAEGHIVQGLIGGYAKDAVVIPYYDLNGNAIPDFVRVRYFQTSNDYKYGQRKGTGTHIYFPKGFDWQQIASSPHFNIIITEGEYKAIALAQAIKAAGIPNLAPMAVAGVSCAFAKGRAQLHPDIEGFVWNAFGMARTVYIAYDYDGHRMDGEPRPEVLQQEAQLVVLLKGQGAKVQLCRVGKHAPNPAEKYAVDDFLHAGKHINDLLIGSVEPVQDGFGKNRLFELASQYCVYGAEVIEIPTGRIYKSLSELHIATGRYVYADAKGTTKYIIDDYLRWEKRVEVKGVAVNFQEMYRKITSDGYYNTAKPFAHEAIAGEIDPWLAFTKYFFQEDPQQEEQFHLWVAHMVQKPWRKHYTCWQFISVAEGIGKSFIAEHVMRMLGQGSIADIVGPDEIFGSFNRFVEGKLLLVANEPSSDNDTHTKKLKHFITSERKLINPKNVNQYYVSDFCNWIFTSNQPFITQMSEGSRRERVYSPRDLDPVKVRTLVAACVAWSQNEGGYSKMMHYYASLDISGFDPTAGAPMSDSKARATALSRSSTQQFAFDLLRKVQSLHPDNNGEVLVVHTSKLMALYTMLEGNGRIVNRQILMRACSQVPNTLMVECEGGGYWVVGNHRVSATVWDTLTIEQQRARIADCLSKQQGILIHSVAEMVAGAITGV